MDLASRTGEQSLVAALRGGDEQAFTTLVGRHTPGLLRAARGHVRDAAAAEEVVQDTWLALVDGLSRFEERSSLQTWLYRVVLNRSRTRAVRDARTVPLCALEAGPTVDPDRYHPADDPGWPGHWAQAPRPWQRGPEAQLESAEVLEQLRQAIKGLPERQRDVLVLRDVEGLTAQEVGQVLGLTPGNVRVLLHRGRARVRSALEGYPLS